MEQVRSAPVREDQRLAQRIVVVEHGEAGRAVSTHRYRVVGTTTTESTPLSLQLVGDAEDVHRAVSVEVAVADEDHVHVRYPGATCLKLRLWKGSPLLINALPDVAQ